MSILLTVILPLILIPAFFIVDYFVAKEFYKAAVMKGWDSRKYFWICFFLLFAGYILVAALPDRGGKDMSAFHSDDLPEI